MVRVVSATVVFMMVAVAASFGAASAKEHDAEPRAAYTLKPVADGSDVVALEVTVQLGGVEGGPDRALMELPLVSWNVPTVAASLARIEAIDATGPVALVARDEGQDATAVRRWYPERPTVGPVMVRYAARPAVEDAPRGAAPPVDLRAEEGAISGGAAIVLLRAAVPSAHLTLDWDLSALPVGSAALSSPLPVGTDSASAHPLEQVYFMAGRLHRYPEDATGHGFFSAWQGTPPLDARALMQWTGALYGHYEQFFGTSPAPYGVFLRRNPVNAGGGMGMNRSFIVTFGAGAGSDPTELKFTLAHEMFHTFQPTMKAPEELSSAWFNEGLAVYYQRVLPLRYGLIDADAFLKDLNFHAARYYTSALGNVPNSEIPARFWKDTRIRTLPYDRGFLYLVTVDEAVRRASKGRRSLDDLMLAMKTREDVSSQPLTEQDWSDLLRRELGPKAVEDFERMLQGATPLPGSGAFGPCFRRTSKQLRRYEIGFEPAVLTESPRIVRGLVPGSAAQAAGLRNGDEILKPVPQDRIQGMQDEQLHLAVRRGETTLDIVYRPRGAAVAAWQWTRVSGQPPTNCSR